MDATKRWLGLVMIRFYNYAYKLKNFTSKIPLEKVTLLL